MKKNKIISVLLISFVAVLLFLSLQTTSIKNLDLTTISGEKITSQQLLGKITLINFWATDCPGCINEMPGLIETYNQYKDQGLEVIAVAMYYDPPSRVISFTKNNNLPFHVLIDNNKEIISKFNNVKLTPTSIVLDKNGNVINTIIGEINFNDFNKNLVKLLN
ncbi:MAG: TlpA disulfide reductase family protein [Methylophilaceae bacterium]|nr:TlpA disulfide reductase family protein [Methylophilaceae bacterium]